MSKQTTFEKLVSIFGNVSATARGLDLDKREVFRWQAQGFIPYKKGELIEKKTKGKIKAAEVWESAARRG